MYRFILSFLFLSMLFIPAGLSAQVLLNEIQASNSETVFDEDGEAADWIELFNAGTESVQLDGYGLSDDDEQPFRWLLPDVSIAPGDYLLIWASGKDRTDTSSPLHTNFSINREGEPVLLTNPAGEIVDELPPTSIPAGLSYGRFPDGNSTFHFFDEPTPGSSNINPGYSEIVTTPHFSHPGGQYRSSFYLTLSSDENTDIYYTRNGEMPTIENSIRYSEPIAVNGSYIIRARAFKEGALSSEVNSQIYNLLSPNIADFSSNLPLIIINDYDSQLSPGDRTPGAITFIEPNGGERTRLDGDDFLQSRMVINKRGSSSLMFPKNMFGFHLHDEHDENRSEPLLGLPREHNWILYAPYTDFTMMRNVVAYRLSEDMGWYAPRTRFVELYLHTGNGPVTQQHYHGLYVLVERIKWDSERVNITQIEPHENEEPEISGGYIIKKDRLNSGESGFRTRKGTLLAHSRPSEQEISPQQRNWIRDYMSDFEDTLYGPGFDDPQNGYEKYIHVDSFIDHFLHTELLKEIDGYRLSTFMYKDRGGKLIMGPVWDYNLSLGIGNYLEGWLPQGWYYIQALNDCFVGCGVRDWYERLMEDENYMNRMQQRWWELRQGVFSREHLFGMIAGNIELLQESQVRDFQKWPRLGQYVWPNWFVGNSWMEEVIWMRNWLDQRISWMDSQMGPPPERVLHTFWYFDESIPNNTPLKTVDAAYTTGGGSARIEFHSAWAGYPYQEGHERWREASMERRNRPTELNYRTAGNGGKAYQEEEMRALQVRQPFRGDGGENSLIFHLPTDDSGEIVFSFAAMDEGAASRLIAEYSVSPEGTAWISSGLLESILNLTDEYQLYTLDFTEILEVNDNPHFKIRIRFDGDDLTASNGGRVTFNNISLDHANPDRADLPDSIIGEPGPLKLFNNYPNPFSDTTQIEYRIPHGLHVKLEVYDTLGRKVATLIDQMSAAGTHRVFFDGSGLSSGLYIYRLTTSFDSVTGKMMLIR